MPRTVAILSVMALALTLTASAGDRARTESEQALDPLRAEALEVPVQLSFRDTPIAGVFRSLAGASGVEFRLEIDGDRPISIRSEKITVKEALVRLAAENDLAYEVLGPVELLVKEKTGG